MKREYFQDNKKTILETVILSGEIITEKIGEPFIEGHGNGGICWHRLIQVRSRFIKQNGKFAKASLDLSTL
jgi:hypothetical protein